MPNTVHPLPHLHFAWRAGFGPTAEMLPAPQGRFNPDSHFEKWWEASQQTVQPLTVSNNAVEGLMNGLGAIGQMQQLSEEKRKEMRQEMQRKSREDLKNLNLEWLEEMVQSPAQLREKLSLFWHGHFACRNLNSFYQQQLLQEIREGALGNFGDLLRNVSKSAAMLAFLNNQQNRKQSPNENFAREVMELFTLGRGHYTETDIKEAARAFTGWGFELNGDFVFRKAAHDTGSKTVLGKTGYFNGDDIIDILLEKKETALFITRKLYRFLVNTQVNESQVQWLADRFYKNGYAIKGLLKDIMTADWFYDPANTGTHIKSPVELWVGIRRLIPVELENPELQLLLQRSLGQILLYPPSVAGWPEGKNWIDSSSLMLRMRLPQLLAMAEPFELGLKQDDDLNMGKMEGNRAINRFRVKGDVHWDGLKQAFSKTPAGSLVQSVARHLLQTVNLPLSVMPETNKADDIARLATVVMTTPEYQLS